MAKHKTAKIALKHVCLKLLRSFHKEVADSQVALGKTATIASWVSKVRHVSLSMDYPGIDIDARMAFRGDALEVLAEYLMKVMPTGHNAGLSDYLPVPLKEDFGVDAVGAKNGVKVMVQCKFRSNRKDLVHYADLARTFTHGVLRFGMDPAARKNLWLVTTADDANHISKDILGKNLHVLGYGFLSKNLDGNQDFWEGLSASINS